MNCLTNSGAIRLVALVAGVLVASVSHAQYVSGYVTGGVHEFYPTKNWNDSQSIYSTTPAQLNTLTIKSISVGDGAGKEASGMVGGSLGTLKARAVSKYPHGGSSNYSNTHANINVLDYVTVTSSTLAQGTVVNVNFTMSLEGSFSNPTFEYGGVYQASLVAGLQANGSLSSFSKTYQNLNGNPIMNLTATMTAKVGEKISLSYYLDASSYVSAYATVASTAVVDVSNTAHIYATSSNSGVTLVGTGGYNYAATPEPATVALAGLGVATFLRRKRKESR